MALLLVLFGPVAFGVLFALAVLNVPALRGFRDQITGRAGPEGPDTYDPRTDPTFAAALDALTAAAEQTPAEQVSFELYVAPGELQGVDAIQAVPVMHSRTVEPGQAMVFDRLRGRYLVP